MKIISWNVNGIESTHRKGCLEALIDKEDPDKEGPDILCIQEVKSKKPLPKLPDYKYVYENPSKERGGGVAIYSKIKPITCQKSMWPLRFDSAGRILTLKFQDFNLITVYAPTGASNIEDLSYKYIFYDKFTQYIRKSDKPAIICGDFNRISQEKDAKNPEEMRKKSGFLPQEEAWFDYILNHGYIDAFRHFHEEDEEKFSWWPYGWNARDNNRGLRLDYFLVNKELEGNLKGSDILECKKCEKYKKYRECSDHAPIVLELEF